MSEASFVLEGEEGLLSDGSSERDRDPYEEFLHRFVGPEPDIQWPVASGVPGEGSAEHNIRQRKQRRP